MLIAGGLAGLAGMNQILGGATEYALGNGIAGEIGFDAITVALLGKSNPIGVVFAGILMGGLRAGGSSMQAATSTPIDIVLVVQSLIVLFIAAPPLVRKIFRLRAPSAGVEGADRHGNRHHCAPRRTGRRAGPAAPISYKAPDHHGRLRAARDSSSSGWWGRPGRRPRSTWHPGRRGHRAAGPCRARPRRSPSLAWRSSAWALAGLALMWARKRKPVPAWAMALFGVAFIMSFLTWAASGKSIPLTGLLQGSLLLSVPLIFGALSGVLCERAGVVNIAIEGQLLAGAFLSAVVGSLTNSLLAGLHRRSGRRPAGGLDPRRVHRHVLRRPGDRRRRGQHPRPGPDLVLLLLGSGQGGGDLEQPAGLRSRSRSRSSATSRSSARSSSTSR